MYKRNKYMSMKKIYPLEMMNLTMNIIKFKKLIIQQMMLTINLIHLYLRFQLKGIKLEIIIMSHLPSIMDSIILTVIYRLLLIIQTIVDIKIPDTLIFQIQIYKSQEKFKIFKTKTKIKLMKIMKMNKRMKMKKITIMKFCI